jgi:hypothetical protein
LGVVKSVAVEVWESKKDASPDILDVYLGTPNGVEVRVGGGASVEATVVPPVVVVRLDHIPFAFCRVQLVFVGGVKPVSCNDNAFIALGSCKDNVSKSIDFAGRE